MYYCTECNKEILSEVRNEKGKLVVTKMRAIHRDLVNEDIKIKPKKCLECITKKYGKISRGYSKKERQWIYEMSDEEVNNYAKKFGVTLENQIKKYGKEEGTRRYNEYCKKQALTNTFEYKKEKYGMSEEEFKEYNQSRACTLENLIKRHGEKVGREKWSKYVETQRHAGCSLEYFKEKYGDKEGEKKYKEVNKMKLPTVSNFIRKYGEKIGKEKYNSFISKNGIGSSIEANNFFKDLIENTNIKNVKYSLDNDEYMLYDEDKKKWYLYDFVLEDKKLVIEYNGDIWHGNPKLFNESDKPNPYKKDLTAKEIWKQDKEKLDFIKNKGFKVLVIWSSDKDKLQKAIDFLKENDAY